MAWYLRTIRGGTDGVPYETLDLALEQVRNLKDRERRQGHRIVTRDGRVSFYDGPDLIDTVRIEDEEGMLGATFEFAKLAVSSLILLNAAHGKISVLFFAFGAGLGGWKLSKLWFGYWPLFLSPVLCRPANRAHAR
jgi:hypothetical protein